MGLRVLYRKFSSVSAMRAASLKLETFEFRPQSILNVIRRRARRASQRPSDRKVQGNEYVAKSPILKSDVLKNFLEFQILDEPLIGLLGLLTFGGNNKIGDRIG